MALMKSPSLVDRRQVSTSGGPAFEYLIRTVGEDYIKQILENPPEKRKTKTKKKLKSHQLKKNKKIKLGLKERIFELKKNKFFAKPKESKEVRDELDLNGFPYNQDTVSVALLRMVKKRVLRRIREVKNKKTVYKYCNL